MRVDDDEIHQGEETDAETQVLTFSLRDEIYCLSIEYVEEIVDSGEMTELPESEDYVEGIMNLRGSTTTVVNPTKILETDTTELATDGGSKDKRIIVLDTKAIDSDMPVGWLVSDVNEVRTVAEETVDIEAVDNTEMLRGLISEEDGFTIWLNPSQLIA
ncbi:MAG: chemotaxis protein CheW [Halorhabdus sp.]